MPNLPGITVPVSAAAAFEGWSSMVRRAWWRRDSVWANSAGGFVTYFKT